MKMKSFGLSLAAVLASLTLVFEAKATEYTSTYSTTQCQDYETITSMLIGKGVTRKPVGAKISQTSSVQVGVFSNLNVHVDSTFPSSAWVLTSFTNGVILSTGKISDGSSTVNESPIYEWADDALPYLGVDADLNAYFKEDLSDPAGIILYIQPKNKTINIPFLMASEEYYADYSQSAEWPSIDDYKLYSDRFAFFLQEVGRVDDPTVFDAEGNVIDPGTSMTNNIAKLPDGGDVEIASVNQHTNLQYFVSNVVSNQNGDLIFPATDLRLPMEFNGAIVGPVAVATGLDTNKIYKLKLIIGDSYDNTINSAVFLRERGITSGADLAIDVEGPTSQKSSGKATFTDTVSNVGPATADGVQVTHYLPFGVDKSTVTISCGVGSVDPASWGEVGGTNYFVWTVGDHFVHGSNAVMTVSCQLPESGVYTNSARVVTSTGDYDESNDRDELVTLVGEPRVLRVAAISTNKVYGTEISLADLKFVLSIDGTNETEIATGIDVTFTNQLGEVAYPTNATAAVGSYGILLSNIRGFDLADFGSRISYLPGVLTIEKAQLTIRANDATKEYGEEKTFAGTEFTVTAGTLAAGDKIDSVTLASEGAAATAPWRAAGYPIQASNAQGTGLDNYEITYEDGTLSLTKRALTVKANDVTKKYGDLVTFAGTEFTLIAGSLKNGDTIDSVTLASAGAAATAEWRAEGYPITAADAQGTGLDNYEITYVDGTLTITKLALTIKANDRTKAYGETVTFAGTEFSLVSGVFLFGDRVDSVTLASEGAVATAPWKAEGYPIKVSNAVGVGLTNYEITYVDGKLDITKLALTIKANDATKQVGDTLTFAGTEFTITTGTPVNGDTVTRVTLTSEGAVATAPWKAEGYPIVASNAQGTGLGNYEITYLPGTLRLTKRALTITANDATKKYGEEKTFAGTEFTITSGALVPGDSITRVTLASTGAVKTAPWTAEGYPITASNAQGRGLDNYEITYQPGTLRITRLALTITANDATKRYGDELVFAGTEFAITSGALMSGDTVESVTLASDGAVATAPYKPEGYPIHASAAVGTGLENYIISYADGTLTLTKRTLEITAKNQQKDYGEQLDFIGDEFEITDGELATGDTVDSVTLASDGAAATAAYKAEGYPITASDAVGTGLDNYEITYVDGTLMINKLTLTITARDAQKQYGDAVTFAGTEFDVTSGTLKNGDAVTSVTLTSDGAAASAPYRSEGYPITASNAQGTGLANYDITYLPGTLRMTKCAITITAKDAVKRYGDTLAFAGTEFTVTGTLKNGDAVTSVTLASDGAAASAPYRSEGYPITASDAQGRGLENYDITYLPGTLRLTKRVLEITANDATKKYGETVTFAGTEFTITAGELASGDAVTQVTLTSEGAPATAAYRSEGYPITASNAQGAGLANYEITYKDGTLRMTKLALTITANDATKRYGEVKTFAGTEFTVTGDLKAGDSVDSVTLASEGAAATAVYKAEGYPITASAAQGTGLDHYDITYRSGMLMIVKPQLTITANDATKAYGEVLDFAGTEFTVAGELANGEQITAVSITSAKAAAADTVVGTYADEIVPAHEVQGINTNNYDIAFVNGTLTVTQAVLTISVNDVQWRVGKARPANGFADFTSQLQANDTMADITGGTGVATDVTFTNAVWTTSEPTVADKGRSFADEIWIDLASLTGARAANYAITIDPGDLTIVKADPELRTSIESTLNWNTGLIDLTLTITNVGDGEVAADADYWVELAKGPAASGETASVAHSFYLDSPTGTLSSGSDYLELTSAVKDALAGVGNGNTAFDPGETVTVGGVSVYHWQRWSPAEFIDANSFFVTGKLDEQTVVAQQQVKSMSVAGASVEASTSQEDTSAAQLAVDTSAAQVFDGMLLEDSQLAGTIQLKLAKTNRRTGLSKLKATIQLAGAKKLTTSGTFDATTGMFVAEVKGGSALNLSINAEGLSGTYGAYRVWGVRNLFNSKLAADQSAVAEANSWVGTYALAVPSASGWDAYQLTVAKKGAVKIRGTLAAGVKVSAKAQMLVEPGVGCAIPVVVAKNGLVRMCRVELTQAGMSVYDVEHAVIGACGGIKAAATFGIDTSAVASLLGDAVKAADLPNGVEIAANGSRWTVAANSSNLKLSYATKTGFFKGSFTIYQTVNGKVCSVKATVNGVVVDGIGYGAAQVKNTGSFAVGIE